MKKSFVTKKYKYLNKVYFQEKKVYFLNFILLKKPDTV